MAVYLGSPSQQSIYGGNKTEVKEKTQQIIKQTVTSFKQAIVSGTDPIALFHSTLAHLADKRSQLAYQNASVDAENFGMRRDGERYLCPGVSTFISGQYAAYNSRMIERIQSLIDQKKDPSASTIKTVLPPSNGRSFSYECTIMSHEQKDKWNLDPKETASIGPVFRNAFISNASPSSRYSYMRQNHAFMKSLKNTSSEVYKKYVLNTAVFRLDERFKDFKSHYILTTARLEVDHKMYAISQYFTSGKKDANGRLGLNQSSVLILHQDSFLIEPMLDDIAKVFKQAIEWNHENVEDLKNTVALFTYEMAHTMPFNRGSAMISEWLEMAIYQFHDYELTYNTTKMINMEALTSSVGDFVKNYDSMIVLSSIKE